MEKSTGILIALVAVAVVVVGGIIIVDTVGKQTQDAQVPSVNIPRVYSVFESQKIYCIEYDYSNFYKGQTIVFFVDSQEVKRVKIEPNAPSGHRNFDFYSPDIVPTIANTSYTIIP